MQQAPKPVEAPRPKGKKTWVIVAAVVIVIIVAVAGLYFAGYLGRQSTGTPVSIFENPIGTCSTAQNCGYTPALLNVTVGTKVTWTNNGQLLHTVTAPDPSAPAPPANFDSGTMNQGQTFIYPSTIAGTYHYYCTIHPWMKAQLVVT